MDPRFVVSREEFNIIQLDVRHLQAVQGSYAERLARVEKRQQDEAAMKAPWTNSPFPSALGGTPQNGRSPFVSALPESSTELTESAIGPIHHMPATDMFDLDDQSHALASLHLDADDEPMRRGAASRANSVRFDESANWGQNTRHSGDFGLPRPGSGLMMERSLSHKSDGRHSSAGHSVHSVHSVHSTHSMASGRGSSLALDTNFMTGGHDQDSPLDMPEPAPGLFILGSVPAIVRCWLTRAFANSTLRYAALCSGAQKSTLEYSLVKELGLADEVYRDEDGTNRIGLSVYLAEAIVSHSGSRSPNPDPQIPSIRADFEVVGVDRSDSDAGAGRSSSSGSSSSGSVKKGVRIFVGSDTLRAHNADLLFSRNMMTLYSQDRDRLSVPFVRPEDDSVFKNLVTMNGALPEKPKLNAAAAEFVCGEPRSQGDVGPGEEPEDGQGASRGGEADTADAESQAPLSPMASQPMQTARWINAGGSHSESGGESERPPRRSTSSEHSGKDTTSNPDGSKREPSAIWGSWRQGTSGAGSDSGGQRENGPLSGYQPALRSRTMKVLRTKSSSSSARTGASYEPAPAPRSGGEQRRKSQVLQAISATSEENGTGGGSSSVSAASSSGAIRWESRRSMSGASSASMLSSRNGKTTPRQGGSSFGTPDLDAQNPSSAPRSANPVGGASAFAWMNPSKPKASAATAE